ncbi:MAG: hypothetical protein SV775_02435 [Thermodesulfobacteriota bacterium]|nr:hypothetical protein [Thermodesulfobacteriota bacterium]
MTLARREKYLLSFTACCIAVFLALKFIIFPVVEKRERLQRGIRAKEQALREIVMLRADYRAYKNSLWGMQELLSRREKGFTLFSFLEQAAGRADVKDSIKYMKPSTSEGKGPYKESMVEIKLEGITLKRLVRFLYRVESTEDVTGIRRISIKENRGGSGYLDAIIQVSTFQKIDSAQP